MFKTAAALLKSTPISLILIALLIILSCSGCVKQSEYDEARASIAALEQRVSDTQQELDKALAESRETKAELDEIKNGAGYRIAQIRRAYENKNHALVVSRAAELHELFNGAPEDNEAQALAAESQKALDLVEAKRESEKKAAEAKALKTAQDKAREIIHVTKLAAGNPNIVGGVDLFIGYVNMSEKVMKYATFTVVPYNAVDDVVTCEIRNISEYVAQDVGPKAKGEGIAGDYSWYWQCAWYNSTIDRLEMTEIEIEYIDGSREILTGDDIGYVIY
ncbi:MAG: hypothetical protein RR235_08010 [Oscillospiraceae bacterium]